MTAGEGELLPDLPEFAHLERAFDANAACSIRRRNPLRRFGNWLWKLFPIAVTRPVIVLGDPDREKAGRVMNSMFKMTKIIIQDLIDAAEGK